MIGLEPRALAELEAAVARALESGDPGELDVLGYGEISTVVGAEAPHGRLAVKRLPPFGGLAAFEGYARRVADYLEALEAGGIVPLGTVVQAHPLEDGRVIGYCVQERVEPGALVHRRLGQAAPGEALDLLDAVVDLLEAAVSPRLGVDGQVSNWVVTEGGLRYLDVSTPLLRDESGRELLDTELFLASLPAAVRGVVRWRFLRKILDKYYDRRGVVVDLAGNLLKEGLGELVQPFLARVNGRELARPAITVEEVRRYYASDAAMWELLQRLRRLDRLWQSRVRRRTYEFLLPGRIDRGP